MSLILEHHQRLLTFPEGVTHDDTGSMIPPPIVPAGLSSPEGSGITENGHCHSPPHSPPQLGRCSDLADWNEIDQQLSQLLNLFLGSTHTWD